MTYYLRQTQQLCIQQRIAKKIRKNFNFNQNKTICVHYLLLSCHCGKIQIIIKVYLKNILITIFSNRQIGMRFKFVICLFCILLISQSMFLDRTVRMLQNGNLSDQSDGSLEDNPELPNNQSTTQTNVDVKSSNETSNTTELPLTQQLPGQLVATDDQYQHLPINLDDQDKSNKPTQQPIVLNDTIPKSQIPINQEPHVTYKGQQNFTYPDDSPGPSSELVNKNSNQSISTSQQQPQTIFGDVDNTTQRQIEEFKPEDIEKIDDQNKNETGQTQPGTKGNQTHEQQKPQQQLYQNSTHQVQNQTHIEQNQTQISNASNTAQPTQTKPELNNTSESNSTANQSSTSNSSTQQTTLLEQKITQLTQQLLNVQTSNNLLTGERNQLQNELLVNKKQNSQLKQGLEQTKAQIKELQFQFQAKLSTAETNNRDLTEKNLKLTQENHQLKQLNQQLQQQKAKLPPNPQNQSQTQSQPSSTQQTELLTKLQEQKKILQNEQKLLNQLNQAINSLKTQSQASHQIVTTPSNPVLPQQLNSLGKKLTQLHTAVQQLSTQQKSQKTLSTQQQSLLTQVLEQVKSLRSTQSTPPTPGKPLSETPSSNDPKNVEQSSTPMGIRKQQKGYRVDVFVDWMSIYIVVGVTGVIVLLLGVMRFCKGRRNIKKGKAEDQKQLKTPQFMDSRTSEEQFSDWQG